MAHFCLNIRKDDKKVIVLLGNLLFLCNKVGCLNINC